VKTGRTEEGPSILNNAKTILADYSQYRYVRENPIFVRTLPCMIVPSLKILSSRKFI
jgi:hypothetical protein